MADLEESTSLPVEEYIENLILKEKQEKRPEIADETHEEKIKTREQFLREEFKTLKNKYFALRDYKGIG